MNYYLTNMDKSGNLTIAAAEVTEVNGTTATMKIDRQATLPDGSTVAVPTTIHADLSKTGTAVKVGDTLAVIGNQTKTGNNEFTIAASTAGVNNCRLEYRGNDIYAYDWQKKRVFQPSVLGFVMGDAQYEVKKARDGRDQLKAKFHIEEPNPLMGKDANGKMLTSIVSDSVTIRVQNKFQSQEIDNKSKDRFDHAVKILSDQAEKAGLSVRQGCDYAFERYPFKSAFLFNVKTETFDRADHPYKSKNGEDRISRNMNQIHSFTAEDGRNAGNTYYWRSEDPWKYDPNFETCFGTPDMERIKEQEADARAFNDREETREAAPAKEAEGVAYEDPMNQPSLDSDNPFENGYAEGNRDYGDDL